MCPAVAKLEQFANADYHKLALQRLEACPVAMERLGSPPLKVHNIHLSDRYNRVDQHTAQVPSTRGDEVTCSRALTAVTCVAGEDPRERLQNWRLSVRVFSSRPWSQRVSTLTSVRWWLLVHMSISCPHSWVMWCLRDCCYMKTHN